MSLADQLMAAVKEAMRGGETLRRDTLRMVVSALKNRRIELGSELTPEQEMAVLSSAVKSRADSAAQYDQAGRSELAEKERAEIAVIEGYLPEQLGPEEIQRIVGEKIAELGLSSKQELGQLMKAVMADHKGAVDGKLVQQAAAALLS